MMNAYALLEQHFQRLAQLDHAMTFLQWDQQVMMPPAGNHARARAIAELAAMHHELLTSRRMGDLLAEAGEQVPDPGRQRSLLEMARVRQRAVCISPELVKAKSIAGSTCEHGWRTQRGENDWAGFLNNFGEVVRLSREEAQARQAAAPERFSSPYDALLDLYCTGDDSNFIRQVFEGLKQELPGLLHEVMDLQPERGADLRGSYPLEAQEALNRDLMACLGFDFDAGRLDVSMHPFSTGGRGDQRITTRFRDTDFADALMATAHETGHASYESGLPLEWEGLPVGQARNMCLHESQSLLYEKHIYLSRAFTGFYAGVIHEFLPQIKNCDSQEIWDAGVYVRPSLIRIEADEVSYPLHVILRFEIESGLINGQWDAADIPEVWDGKMREYFGLSTKDNYTDGCLQDIHWTDGSFGYFPSYTLGALNAAQLSAAIRKAHPDWQDRLGRGEVTFIRKWLGDRVWSKGSLMESQDIIAGATGEGTNPVYLLEHLRARYIDRKY